MALGKWEFGLKAENDNKNLPELLISHDKRSIPTNSVLLYAGKGLESIRHTTGLKPLSHQHFHVCLLHISLETTL